MIFPQAEDFSISIIFCPICKKHYRANSVNKNMSCLVMHGPGSCCHYNDLEISEEKVKQLEETLNG